MQSEGTTPSSIEKYKLLDVETEKNAVQRLGNHATKAIYVILHNSRKLCLPIDIKIQLFDAMVMPVWGFQRKERRPSEVITRKPSSRDEYITHCCIKYSLKTQLHTKILPPPIFKVCQGH